jgi:hypothetical protein
VDDPWTSGKIVAPSRKKYALAGFAAGFAVMCALFILKELLNNTYKTEADITKDLELPVLGVIPLEEGENRIERVFRAPGLRRGIVLSAAGVLLLALYEIVVVRRNRK